MGAAILNEAFRAAMERAAEQCGCELVHVEFRTGVLRLVIDHPEGVTLQHCEAVSDQASVTLDAQDWGRGRYTLEVTSPGVERPLYGERDFQRFIGRTARVRYRSPATGGRETRVFILLAVEPSAEGVTVQLKDPVTEAVTSLPLQSIEEARLAWEWPKRTKKKEERSHAANAKHRRYPAR